MSAAPVRSPRLVTRCWGSASGSSCWCSAAVFLVFSWQAQARFTASWPKPRAEPAALQRIRGSAPARATEPGGDAGRKPDAEGRRRHLLRPSGTPADRSDQLAGTLHGELAKMQRAMGVAALSVTDTEGRIVATAGPLAADWAPGSVVPPRTWLNARSGRGRDCPGPAGAPGHHRAAAPRRRRDWRIRAGGAARRRLRTGPGRRPRTPMSWCCAGARRLRARRHRVCAWRSRGCLRAIPAPSTSTATTTWSGG